MSLPLKDRVALVTGSSRGLGFSIAKTLLKAGAQVIITARDPDNLKLASDSLQEHADSNEPIAWPADITKPEEIADLFGKLKMRIGRLDILVNNAGRLVKFGEFADLRDDDWQEQFNVGLMSMVRFCRHAIPLLKESGHGRIINISSVASHQPGLFNPHYGAVKAAMNTTAKFLANDLGQFGTTVNTVCPATLEGGIWHQNIMDRSMRRNISPAQAEDQMLKAEKNKNPLHRIGQLNDVAELVLYLASDKASFLTGQIYNVDGGLTKKV